MVVIQARARRKPSGGLYRSTLSKRTHMRGRTPALPKVGGTLRVARVGTKGGGVKRRLLETGTANLLDPKTGKHAKATIKIVTENPANRNYVRRNILTKGTIIETDKGKARVTNRPGQDGFVNATLT